MLCSFSYPSWAVKGMTNKLVILWAPPRSLSTAFVRMIEARGDFTVLHEPLCDLAAGHVFTHEVQGETHRIDTPNRLFAHVRTLLDKGNVFIKDTCEFSYAGLINEGAYPDDAHHAFMIRNPEQVINSHYAMNPQLTSQQVGYQHLDALYCAVRARGVHDPVIVDANQLVLDPQNVIGDFCRKVGIEQKPESLQWEPGHRQVWERTRHWHEDAARSTSIRPVSKHYEVRVDNDPRLKSFYDDNLVVYKKFLSYP